MFVCLLLVRSAYVVVVQCLHVARLTGSPRGAFIPSRYGACETVMALAASTPYTSTSVIEFQRFRLFPWPTMRT
jgi:hypothetical protein